MDANTIAWVLLAFIAGMATGGYVVHNLTRGVPQLTMKRTNFEWARRDVYIPEPIAKDTPVRKITDWQDAPLTDGRTMTFTVFDSRSGLYRDLTYTGVVVLRFFKCDTPTRSEWRGNNNDYSRLLAIGKHYGWLIPEGVGYGWAHWLATRERRLRVLVAWLTH